MAEFFKYDTRTSIISCPLRTGRWVLNIGYSLPRYQRCWQRSESQDQIQWDSMENEYWRKPIILDETMTSDQPDKIYVPGGGARTPLAQRLVHVSYSTVVYGMRKCSLVADPIVKTVWESRILELVEIPVVYDRESFLMSWISEKYPKTSPPKMDEMSFSRRAVLLLVICGFCQGN